MHKVIWEEMNLNLGKQIINGSEDNSNGITQNSLIASHCALGFNFIENKEFNHSKTEIQNIWKRNYCTGLKFKRDIH